MYSQHDEERFILDKFRDKCGRFLDIGAHNGVDLSNTRALYDLGWSGVFVEPSPVIFSQLLDNYPTTDRIKLLNCAVDVESKISIFLENNGGYVATLSREHQKMCSEFYGSCFRGMYLNTVTFNELLDSFGTDFDFISLDVEGMDFELLRSMDFSRLAATKMLCVEQKNSESGMEEYLSKFGFVKVHQTEENLLVARA